MSEGGLAYRPDIDGLRAVAILLVVVFHGFPAVLPGGFVGVDIFFVVSGYLIGGIILGQVGAGRFSFAEFYARRACRLFPALAVVLAAVLGLGWLVLLPDEFVALGRHVRAGALYLSNFVLAREAGYFDAAAETKPLLHLWSLAIEEQFYLGFPLLLVLAARRRAALVWVPLAVMAGSFAYGVIDTPRNPVAAFFLPQSRVWELLAGVMLAVAGHLGWRVPGAAWLRGWAGVALIGGAVAVLDAGSPFPGWWAVLPVAGSWLVLSAGPFEAERGAWVNRVVLAHPAMVAVGLVSYPLYLWHWPLLALARVAEGGEPWWGVRLGLVGVAGILAVLTWRYVERPVRFGGVDKRRAAVALLGVTLVVGLAGQGALSGVVRPYASRFGVDRVLAAAGEWDYPGAMERLSFQGRPLYRVAGTGDPVLFVGDSNMEQYAPRMVALLDGDRAGHRTALFLTAGGCAPIPGVSQARLPGCRDFPARVLAAVAEFRPAVVVVAAHWWGYFGSEAYRFGALAMREPAAEAAALAAFGGFLRDIAAGGARVAVVLNIPAGAAMDPRAAVARHWLDFAVVPQSLARARIEAEHGALDRRIEAVARAAGAEVIDPLPHLCGDAACPAAEADGTPMYKDAAHLRPGYVRGSVRYLDGLLRRGSAN
jgi:peptidoglycan/LPS O-acetylase OafA/YrhL